MKRVLGVALVLLLLSFASLACATVLPGARATATPAGTSVPPNPQPTEASGSQAAPTAAPTQAPATTSTPDAPPVTPTTAGTSVPTTAPLELELLQTQVWVDHLGDLRLNVLVRNNHDVAVVPELGAGATVYNAADENMRESQLYFLDGLSGGGGYIMPGETIAANVCFTCDEAPLPDEWARVEVDLPVGEADNAWEIATEVEPTFGSAEVDPGSPLFWVNGSVTNNSDTPLQRISVRFFVYDEAGTLIGAAEASAWDVPAGATVEVRNYGIGQVPEGPVTYEVTALGVVSY